MVWEAPLLGSSCTVSYQLSYTEKLCYNCVQKGLGFLLPLLALDLHPWMAMLCFLELPGPNTLEATVRTACLV